MIEASGTIPEIYSEAKNPVFSFELFPPKTDSAFENLKEILPELKALSPDFMTVTYGALGSTRSRTLEIATLIQNQYRLPTACHLTCVGSSREELTDVIREIYREGIRNIVALRGDPPQGEANFVPPADGFSHANELVAHIRKTEGGAIGRFGIAVAGYPEKHVEAANLDADLANLKRKVDAGADCVVTQLFYDNSRYFDFASKARALGITVPIVPGLLPVLSVKQILRITSMCGSCLPQELKSELDAAGEDLRKAEDIGVRQCVTQARELLANGAPGIHFYVLNKSSHMTRIIRALRN